MLYPINLPIFKVKILIMSASKPVFIFCLFILFSQFSQAQVGKGIVKGMLVEVETTEGMNLIGNVETINKDTLALEYETYGHMVLQMSRVKSIAQIKKETIREDGFWHENKNYSRNFYGPTGMGMEKGNGYYQNILVVWNHLAYAFTDYFTLGVDFEIVSILARLSGEEIFSNNPMPVTALTPKFHFSPTENFHLGAGALFLFVPGTDYFLDAGITYAVGTYGNKDRNATLGIGIPYLEGDIELKSPIVTLSGQYRVNRKIALTTENWFIFPEDENTAYYIGVSGMRYLARKLTWDFGIGFYAGDGYSGFVPIPFVGIVFPFSRVN